MEASWKSETIEALKVLGGIANLNQILDVIIKHLTELCQKFYKKTACKLLMEKIIPFTLFME